MRDFSPFHEDPPGSTRPANVADEIRRADVMPEISVAAVQRDDRGLEAAISDSLRAASGAGVGETSDNAVLLDKEAGPVSPMAPPNPPTSRKATSDPGVHVDDEKRLSRRTAEGRTGGSSGTQSETSSRGRIRGWLKGVKGPGSMSTTISE